VSPDHSHYGFYLSVQAAAIDFNMHRLFRLDFGGRAKDETTDGRSSSSSSSDRTPVSLISFWQSLAALPNHTNNATAVAVDDTDDDDKEENDNDDTQQQLIERQQQQQQQQQQQINQERQVLLLMLLAQVCALHDPTPRTFAVHARELFDRDILDLNAIRFVYDLGLMGRIIPTSSSSPSSSGFPLVLNDAARTAENGDDDGEASSPHPCSVQNHPLKLSRYQRDFTQIGIIATGGFGQVFHVRNHLDEREYAVKRVTNVQENDLPMVLREVQCLAAYTDHPNVVRYYTSWLESSWIP
jgi:Protein kinase domain